MHVSGAVVSVCAQGVDAMAKVVKGAVTSAKLTDKIQNSQ